MIAWPSTPAPVRDFYRGALRPHQLIVLDIQFTGGTCSGGHGLSIGSVGGRDDNDVQDIYIADSTISDSDNGVRIKCNSDTTGSVSNVTYSGITLSGIAKYGIVIEQVSFRRCQMGEPMLINRRTTSTAAQLATQLTASRSPISPCRTLLAASRMMLSRTTSSALPAATG